jgi:hypothetical protein
MAHHTELCPLNLADIAFTNVRLLKGVRQHRKVMFIGIGFKVGHISYKLYQYAAEV